MTIILVLLCIFTSSIQSVLRRGYDDRVRGGGVAFFGAVQSFVSLLVFVAAGAVRGYSFPSEPAMYLYSFGFAAFYGTSISATQAALEFFSSSAPRKPQDAPMPATPALLAKIISTSESPT